jgi:hypothetical protein
VKPRLAQQACGFIRRLLELRVTGTRGSWISSVEVGKKEDVYVDGWVMLIPLVVVDVLETFQDTLWSDIALSLVSGGLLDYPTITLNS